MKRAATQFNGNMDSSNDMTSELGAYHPPQRVASSDSSATILLARRATPSETSDYSEKGTARWVSGGKRPTPPVPILVETHCMKIEHGLISGDTRFVGERHISYLLRQFEVNTWFPCKKPDETATAEESAPATKFEHKRAFGIEQESASYANAVQFLGLQPQFILGAFMFLVFLLVYLPMHYHSEWNDMDCSIMALVFSHVLGYLLVLFSMLDGKSSFGLYRSWSCVDGLNMITRFTVKLGLVDNVDFCNSNMPCSVSSSVSTRGTTLNKLMLTMSTSIGVGLFLKFIQLDNGSLPVMIGFGYFGIVFTGTYENRTFDLESRHEKNHARYLQDGVYSPLIGAGRRPIDHHRYPSFPFTPKQCSSANAIPGLKLPDPSSEPALDISSESKTESVYSNFHGLGVVFFLFVTFAGYSLDFWWQNHRNSRQETALTLSCISLAFGLLFVWLNSVLQFDAKDPKTSNFSKMIFASKWVTAVFTSRQSKHVQKMRGFLCIGIEMVALLTATAAGIVYAP